MSPLPTLETQTDYDLFNYEESDQPLSLGEAINHAATMRAADKSHVYKVIPVDRNQTGFRVQAISREQVYADFLSRISAWLGKRIANLSAR
jgi:hypothetical protein